MSMQTSGIESISTRPDPMLVTSPRYNADIAPTRPDERTWSHWHVAALWVGLSICVPTYTLGGVLTAWFGLSPGEAILTIGLANIIILIPLTLNAYPGTRYGIPFPVVLRSSFGIVGSNVPCLIRALVGCGWFGIQTMFGGMALHLLLSALLPGWHALGGTGEVIGFFLFGALNLYIVIRGAESIRTMEVLAAPLLLAVSVGLLLWALPHVSLVAILQTPPTRPEGAPVYGYFMAGLTAMVGFWATLSLNIPDFSRFARSQRDQVIGQIIGLPLTMFLFASLGVVMTAASPSLTGELISDPITLIGHIGNPFWVIIAMTLIVVATLSTNTAGNIVSPTNDFQNLAPRRISRTSGVLMTGLAGTLMMGFDLLQKLGLITSSVTMEGLLSNWLLGYSSLLGPIAGIMIVDYFLIRRQQLDVRSLYLDGGEYPAWNAAGFIAFLLPVALTLLALLTGQMMWFYDYGWFTGSIMGGLVYAIAARPRQLPLPASGVVR